MNTDDKEPERPGPARRHLSGREALADAVVAILGRAQRNVVVFGPRLEGGLFNTGEVAQALGRLIARHRDSRARLVVDDAPYTLHENARLIELARRFSEFVQIRRVAEEHAGRAELFMVIDGRDYLHQPDFERQDAIVELDSPGRAQPYARRFEDIWARTEPITEITTTGL